MHEQPLPEQNLGHTGKSMKQEGESAANCVEQAIKLDGETYERRVSGPFPAEMATKGRDISIGGNEYVVYKIIRRRIPGWRLRASA